ncbi:MAG: glycosyltransferase, partial [Hyphomicrobiaceae bacterium]
MSVEFQAGSPARETFTSPVDSDFSPGALDALGFIVGPHSDSGMLERAELVAAGWGVQMHEVVLSLGWVSPRDYTNRLADVLGVRSAFNNIGDVSDNQALIDATGARPSDVARAVEAARSRFGDVVLYSGSRPEDGEPESDRRARLWCAVESLRQLAPQLSAGCRMPLWQPVLVCALIGFSVGVTLIDRQLAYFAVGFGIAVPIALAVGLRLLALLSHLILPRPRLDRRRLRVNMHGLPVYTVLVPLYREAEILPDLVDAVMRLDYPAAKLDVLLVLEEVDIETRIAAAALVLPGFIRIITVPDAQPRTKPKALNFAIEYARGEFIAVYDAEDIPEPRQLRDAVDLFHANPEIDFLQARLNIYNPSHSFLTRQFAIEYTMLFDGLLPALERLGVPLPLGGSSNHFRHRVLAEAGAWDPFNVTEDADLGLRLARDRRRVAVLASTTWEEAPADFAAWLPQRTRWIKGWMQTCLVHLRRPGLLWRELGPWGFIGFLCLIGGFLLSVLLHPVLYVIVAVELTRPVPFEPGPTLIAKAFWWLALFNLAGGFLAAILLGVVTTLRRGWPALALLTPLMPLYWLLSSFAAYRALYQLFTAPHH